MKTFAAISATAFVLMTLLQPCPAPPVLAAVGMTAGEAAGVGAGLGSGAIAGGIGAGTKNSKERRQDDNSLPPAAQQACQSQLKGVTVQVSKQGDNNVRFDNVPPACMTLANVFLGQNRPDQPHPIPMGSAALQYNGLTEDQLNTLQQALDTVKKGN